MKNKWILKALVIIGGIWFLLQFSFLPTIILLIVSLVLLFVVGAAAIPGLILYGIGRATGLIKDDPEPSGRSPIEGQTEVVDITDADWHEVNETETQTAPTSISKQLASLLDRHREALSEPVMSRLDAILSLIRELEGFLETPDTANVLHRGSEHHHTVVQTVESYIPEMLDGYLKLPRDFARTHQLPNGQTARDILIEQLDVLSTELKALRNAAYEHKTEELIAHGEFLKSKFQKAKPFIDFQ